MDNIVTFDPAVTEVPQRVIHLTFCELRLFATFCWTAFPDRTGYGAFPDPGPEYRRLAKRLGYADSMSYCVEHEFCHSFIAQELQGAASPVLWALAHGRRAPDITAHEEALVQAFQSFLRGRLPMTAVSPDVDWYEMRDKAARLLMPL